MAMSMITKHQLLVAGGIASTVAIYLYVTRRRLWQPSSTQFNPETVHSVRASCAMRRRTYWQKVGLYLSTSRRLSPEYMVAPENRVGKRPQGTLAAIGYCFQRGMMDVPSEVAKVSDYLDMVTDDHARVAYQISSKDQGVQAPAFTFVAYAPRMFSRLRRQYGIQPVEFLASLGLTSRDQVDTLMPAIGSTDASGKSSSFFFFSPDHRFIIKSASVEEKRLLRGILPALVERSADQSLTLLPRYLGLYKLEIQGLPEIYLVVMNNWFAGKHAIHHRFDLKGSTYKRAASAKEKTKGHAAVFKDLDFVEQRRTLPFTEPVLTALRQDVQLLSECGLIDYSLLVGIHNKVKDEADESWYSKPLEMMDVLQVDTPTQVLYIGIIDILTRYGIRKTLENFTLGRLTGNDVSCQPPPQYAERFMKFIMDNLETTSPSKSKNV